MNPILDKLHLASLPDMKPHQIPKRPENISNRGIVLIPVFIGYPSLLQYDKNHVAHHVAISAVWARRSWLMNTDAHDYGIDVKFYVEDKAKQYALPIFERNYVEASDILFFDGNKLEGLLEDGMTHGIKKCASYNDDRLREYDWIFDVDSDVFVMSTDDRRLPFFQTFFNNCPKNTVAACYVRSSVYQPECLTPIDMGWCMFEGDSIEAWKRRFEDISGRDMVEKYFSPNEWIITCNGSIIGFPAKHFMQEKMEWCDFFIDTTRELLDLEATLSLWHSLGNPLYNITNYAKVLMYHSEAGQNDVDIFNQYCSEGPFIFHYSFTNNVINSQWKEGIGCFS